VDNNGSEVVEQATHNPKSGGSNPTPAATGRKRKNIKIHEFDNLSFLAQHVDIVLKHRWLCEPTYYTC